MDRSRVLVVDDEEALRQLLNDALTEWGFEASTVGNAADAGELVKSRLFDAALVDIWMPGVTGLDLLRQLKRQDSDIEVVMMTGRPEVGTAIEALKLGAYDYLAKPLILAEVHHLLNRLTDHRFLRTQVRSLRRRLAERLEGKELVGVSLEMEQLREMVTQAATADSAVLIQGETGTGKELVAASIHQLSGRGKGPFVPVNCGAIPANLIESELFGHVRGAFSGAVTDAPGLFRAAHGGTLFLDEVAELPAGLQSKLLRVLEEHEVRPVGSAKTYTVDVRVIAATNRSLEEAVADGSLRPDLFYRLDVVRIVLPPLRARKGDISALVHHFLRRFNEQFGRVVGGIRPEALAILADYDFPGNVRELENLIERAYVLGARDELKLADLRIPSGRLDPVAQPQTLPTLADAERQLILRAMELHGNDKERAARALGISPRTIYRRLKEYGFS